jgi:myo-inositol-1(or 4)-monophosphatase
MNDWNLNKIVELMHECGRIAMHFYDDPPLEEKSDNSIVTAADKAVEQRLAQEFDRPAEGAYLIGEETIDTHGEDYIRRALQGNCWVVDPIDGTAPYAQQVPVWGISIGFMRNGYIAEGGVYFPVTGELMITDGPDAWLYRGNERTPFPFKAAALNGSVSLALSQRITRRGRVELTNHLMVFDCVVGVFLRILKGKMLGYICNAKLWDLAGCLPLAERAGFVCKNYDGTYLTCDAAASFQLTGPAETRWQLLKTTVIAAGEERADYIIKGSTPAEGMQS